MFLLTFVDPQEHKGLHSSEEIRGGPPLGSPHVQPPCPSPVLLCPGEVFLSLVPDLEAAYREYLAHYGTVTLVENIYKQQEQLWNQIVAVVKSSAYVRPPHRDPDGLLDACPPPPGPRSTPRP